MIEVSFHYAWVQSALAFVAGGALAFSWNAYKQKRAEADRGWFWVSVFAAVLAFIVGIP